MEDNKTGLKAFNAKEMLVETPEKELKPGMSGADVSEEDLIKYTSIVKNDNVGAAINEILNFTKKNPVISVALEGSRMYDLKGKIFYIVIGISPTVDPPKVYMFDIRSPGLIKTLRTNILENNKIVKIVHDQRIELFKLKKNFSVKLVNVWNTQLAYKEVFGEDDIDLYHICKAFNIKTSLKEDRGQRPDWMPHKLENRSIIWAAEDVFYLWDIYSQMKDKIKDPAAFRLLCDNWDPMNGITNLDLRKMEQAEKNKRKYGKESDDGPNSNKRIKNSLNI